MAPCTLSKDNTFLNIGLMINEQLQTVDRPTDMALHLIVSADLQDDSNEGAPKDAWL